MPQQVRHIPSLSSPWPSSTFITPNQPKLANENDSPSQSRLTSASRTRPKKCSSCGRRPRAGTSPRGSPSWPSPLTGRGGRWGSSSCAGASLGLPISAFWFATLGRRIRRSLLVLSSGSCSRVLAWCTRDMALVAKTKRKRLSIYYLRFGVWGIIAFVILAHGPPVK